MKMAELADHLRRLRGVRHKLDVQRASAAMPRQFVAPNGDDCAAILDHDGHSLLAIEGLLDDFVEAEPWFAGYCAIMVNASDVYAMGGRPVAVVDALWARSNGHAESIWQGMHDASVKYGIPIIGGHTNTQSSGDHLAVAILGRAGHALLTSFDARPGDSLIAAIDLRGEWFGAYPFWNCSTTAAGERLRGDLEILPLLAEQKLCRAAKDISMGGIIGTATMFAECSGVGMLIDVDQIPRPSGVALKKWLSAFPSYGFLLAAAPEDAGEICRRFAARGIAAALVGRVDNSNKVTLIDSAGDRAMFWDLSDKPFIGFKGDQ